MLHRPVIHYSVASTLGTWRNVSRLFCWKFVAPPPPIFLSFFWWSQIIIAISLEHAVALKEQRNCKQKLSLFAVSLLSCFSQKKLNLPLTSGIYLVVLLLEMQRRLKQTKACHTFLLVCLKKSDPHTLKSSSCKNPFLQFVCYRYDLLRWMFLFHVITGIHYFSQRFIVTLRLF